MGWNWIHGDLAKRSSKRSEWSRLWWNLLIRLNHFSNSTTPLGIKSTSIAKLNSRLFCYLNQTDQKNSILFNSFWWTKINTNDRDGEINFVFIGLGKGINNYFKISHRNEKFISQLFHRDQRIFGLGSKQLKHSSVRYGQFNIVRGWKSRTSCA